MRKLYGLFFLLGSISAFGQGYVPPSPDALSYSRAASTSVNYYTGMAAIQIPLTELVSKDIRVPVTLNYNSSGLKVQDIAGAAGLGWNLNAGGLITRIVRGMPDDLTGGYCKPNRTDTEPDLYFFSFLGRTGKFVLDQLGTPVLIPYQDIVIRPGICATGSNNIWEIVDEQGTVYRFGKSILDRESQTTRIITQSTTQYNYTSSWYLSEIVTADGTDKVTFSYLTGSMSYTNYYFSQYFGCTNDLSLKDESTVVTANTRQVFSMTGSLGNIYFYYKNGREDFSGASMLDNITVSNFTNGQISKFRFEYSYFLSDGCSESKCKRLRLDKIYDLAPDPLYTLTYNTTTNLPARDSKNFDHWGYYNANTVNNWITASRAPDATRSLANLLSRIDTRLGGYRQFEFQAHQAYKNSATITVGGARIYHITSNDGNGNSAVREFRYGKLNSPAIPSGLLFREPFYGVGNGVVNKFFSHAYTELYDINGTHIGYSRVEDAVPGQGKTVYNFTNFDTHPDQVAVGSGEGPPFASATYYGWERGNMEIAEIYNEAGALLGKTINEYNFLHANKRQINGSKGISISWSCSGVGSGSASVSGSYTIISRPFTLKKQTRETYDPADVTRKMVHVQEFQYDPNAFNLTRTTQYDATRPTVKYIAETRYVNNIDYNFQASPGVDCYQQYYSCNTGCDSEPDPQVRSWCYQDCQSQYNNCVDEPPTSASPEVAALLALKARHQVLTPIEITSSIQENSLTKILASDLTVYQISGNGGAHVTAKETWSLRQALDPSSFSPSKANTDGTFTFDTKMRKRKFFNSYDPVSGNLLQETSSAGVVTSFGYAHNNSLLTSVTTEGSVPRQITYAYKPMVGVTSQTDANTIVTQYEYDAYNRLKTIKDQQNNILKNYRYHYKGETPGFTIYTAQKETVTNTTVSFYIRDIAAAAGGTPYFVIDFGDGTVIENANPQIGHNHAYSAAGTYTVKLVGMNPEYGQASRTTQIVVYDPLSAYNCDDGPLYVDLCGIDQPYFGQGDCVTGQNQYTWSPVRMSVILGGGCPSNVSYYWEYKRSTDTYWTAVNGNSSTASIDFYPPGEGSFQVRCTITDGCGATTYSYSWVDRYKSNPNCGGGFQN